MKLAVSNRDYLRQKKFRERKRWHKWFAWRPVLVRKERWHKWIWLQPVWRRLTDDAGPYFRDRFWQYSETEPYQDRWN